MTLIWIKSDQSFIILTEESKVFFYTISLGDIEFAASTVISNWMNERGNSTLVYKRIRQHLLSKKFRKRQETLHL